ncbi:MAG: hypothetical protein R3345_08685 [Fulvivirga sp.]|nr:hypothetical protein [Fulvivirga sp.]
MIPTLTYIVLICQLVMIFSVSFAQSSSPDYEQLIKMSDEELIAIGRENISQAYPPIDFEVFDRTKISKDENSICIEFSVSVKYVPYNTAAIYGVHTSLYGPCPATNLALINGKAEIRNLSIYQPSKKEPKTVEWLLAVTEKSDCQSLSKLAEDDNNQIVIKEKKDHYAVEITNRNAHFGYFIKKKRGTCYKAWHKRVEVALPDDLE